jgi:hypothetical protein
MYQVGTENESWKSVGDTFQAVSNMLYIKGHSRFHEEQPGQSGIFPNPGILHQLLSSRVQYMVLCTHSLHCVITSSLQASRLSMKCLSVAYFCI